METPEPLRNDPAMDFNKGNEVNKRTSRLDHVLNIHMLRRICVENMADAKRLLNEETWDRLTGICRSRLFKRHSADPLTFQTLGKRTLIDASDHQLTL